MPYKMYAQTYVFGQKSQKVNTESRSREIAVTGEKLYDRKSGYGFVTESNYRMVEELQLSELSSGFMPAYPAQMGQITTVLSDEESCFIDSRGVKEKLGLEGMCMLPLIFRADVDRSGNYQITVEYRAAGEIMIFAGARRLVYRAQASQEKQTVSFVLNACDIIPMGRNYIYEHKSIDVALAGEDVRLIKISIRQVNCPTIYLAGDSTVNDQSALYPYRPEMSFAGWGQMLPAFLNGKVAVSNHAHSGQTVETFRTEGHYAIIQAHIRFGDYFMIQFAHNDQKLENLRAQGGYKDALARYVEETLSVGAYPVLVTPVCRNTWRQNGEYVDFLGEYAQACRDTAQRYRIPVIDLHEASRSFIVQHGQEIAARYYFPKDFTHMNDYGAYLMAGMLVREYVSHMSGAYAEAYSRLAGYMTQQSIWQPPRQPVYFENTASTAVWYEQDKEAAGQIRSVEELESMIVR